MKIRAPLAVPVLLLLAVAMPAQATLFDFTAAPVSTVELDGITATVTADNGALTWTSFDGDASAPPCATGLLACNYDGIGVRDDEITYGIGVSAESVTVTFSQAVDVSGIHLFDLFGLGDDGVGNPAEVALVEFLDAGSSQLALRSVTGTAAPGTLSGYASLQDMIAGVSSIRFFTDEGLNSDFALAGIEATSVPEPSALALLGIGLLGVGLARRRHTT